MFCPKRKNDENLDSTCNKKRRKNINGGNEKSSVNFPLSSSWLRVEKSDECKNENWFTFDFLFKLHKPNALFLPTLTASSADCSIGSIMISNNISSAISASRDKITAKAEKRNQFYVIKLFIFKTLFAKHFFIHCATLWRCSRKKLEADGGQIVGGKKA